MAGGILVPPEGGPLGRGVSGGDLFALLNSHDCVQFECVILGRYLLRSRVADAAVVDEGVDGIDSHPDGLAAGVRVQLHAISPDHTNNAMDQIRGEIGQSRGSLLFAFNLYFRNVRKL